MQQLPVPPSIGIPELSERATELRVTAGRSLRSSSSSDADPSVDCDVVLLSSSSGGLSGKRPVGVAYMVPVVASMRRGSHRFARRLSARVESSLPQAD